MRVIPVVLVTLVCAARLGSATPPRPWNVGPASSWVIETAVPPTSTTEESRGVHYRLFDQQIQVDSDTVEEYSRTVWQAATTAGVQDADEVQISFDPTFQRLTIHHVRVLREGRIAWSASPADIRVIEAEQNLEERLYNGDLTAVVFPRDLRVGDVIDYAFTLHGQNPVLGGRFDDILGVVYASPADIVRRRLLWPRGRKLHVRACAGAPEPKVEESGSVVTYTWDAQNARPPLYEDRIPSWLPTHARVEVSEFDSWTEVARRFQELFASLDERSPELDALARGLTASAATEGDRLDRAVQFVQDEIRYLGIEIGPNSHAPHSPSETLKRRFGDCKDKSALLVALLRRLNLDAWPALVSTRARQQLDERLPSLFAFDHAIVAVRSGGRLLFVDATASQRGGHVVDRQPPPFARALVLEPRSSGLTTIPAPAAEIPSTEIEETYEVTAWNEKAHLAVATTYRGPDADDIRQHQARSTRAELAKRWRDFYAHEHEGIEMIGEPKVEDDRERNTLVIRESYSIPVLFEDGSHDFRAWAIRQKLARPETLARSFPLSVTHPESIKQTLVVRLPETPGVDRIEEIVTGAAFTVSASCFARGREARLVYTYRSLAASLPPSEVQGHLGKLEHASDLLTCSVGARSTASTRVARGAGDGTEPKVALVIVGCGLVGLLVWGTRAGLSEWQARRRRNAFRTRTVVAAGEAPHSAMAVARIEMVDRQGMGGVCACEGPWNETDRASVQYDGRPMTVVTRRCSRCSGERTVYFRIV